MSERNNIKNKVVYLGYKYTGEHRNIITGSAYIWIENNKIRYINDTIDYAFILSGDHNYKDACSHPLSRTVENYKISNYDLTFADIKEYYSPDVLELYNFYLSQTKDIKWKMF